MKPRIKAGIVGAAGYTGGELLRLLIHHPDVEIAFANSRSQAGKKVCAVHTDLIGETDLSFTDSTGDAADVLFLCVGHGEAKPFLEKNKLGGNIRVIDLTADHRLNDEFVYGLPELNEHSIKSTTRLANPGCFATAIQLSLLPLASHGLITAPVNIVATTGATGAGQQLSETSHFAWRNNNLSVYKAFEHQHLAEIRQTLKKLQPKLDAPINFVPMRGDFSRGILASVHTQSDLEKDQVLELFENYYSGHPFVHVSSENIHLKQVVNTNKCLIYPDKYGKELHIVSAIDNLLKGASGQAVQNMNLMFGLDQHQGLKLKAVAY